jgi:BirA family biotin operon repressor/biotin-[acetyl-CoA-carboxylase] ligase
MRPLDLLAALSVERPLSGAALASRLGVSRTAVWKQIERLRAWGVDVVAEGGRGYRLTRPFERLDAARIRGLMEAHARRALHTLEVVDEIDSTNAELQRRASAGAAGAIALFAEHQSAGRGRRGREWYSPPGANLYLSLLWRFERGLGALGGLSLAVAMALAESLRVLGLGAMIKWPNDVVVGQRKMAGILVDAGGELHGPCHAVIGLGLNLALPTAATRAIDQPWTDLASELGSTPERNRTAALVLSRQIDGLLRFVREGLAPFLTGWQRYDALAGRIVDVIEGDRRYAATACGVDAEGRLKVREDGSERVLASADVSIRRRPA